MRIKEIIPILTLALLILLGGTSQGNPLDNDATISLELDAVPISTVLQMIASQNKLNIVISDDVEGEVSLNIHDVPIKTALEAILIPNGFNYYVQNDVVIIKPIDINLVGELLSHVITLKYLDPATVQKVLAPRLSPKGKITIVGRDADGDSKYSPNRILITDLPRVVEELIELITELDIRERIVSIKVRIIETKVDTKSRTGFVWPTSISMKLGADVESSESTTETSEVSTTGITGSYDLHRGKWTWGTLTADQLRLVLDLLNQNGNSKLISDPYITTTENQQAEIVVETRIPIPTINRFTEGASVSDILTFQDEKIGLTLNVTPRINEEGRITLNVFSRIEDIIGYSGPSDNQKPITASRSIRTRITVYDGETAALGGLLKEDDILLEQRLPLLGSIPIIGKLLFTNTSKEKATTDLTILITPQIVE